MAHHIRRQLRAAIAAALRGLPTTGANVFPGRTWPREETIARGLLIYARGGVSQFDGMGDSDAEVPLDRNERVIVEGFVHTGGGEGGPVSIDDLLDDIAAEVEPVMMADSGIAALVDRRELIDTIIDAHVGGDARRGSIQLVYRFVYATSAGDPTNKV